ncbi:MAG TPA: hypothetical protein VLT61_11265 [Anaeromyxobacteraceae bacterium]|nr:hypothetical protein [Anaeromyxobacteraceae bacterium]
MSRFASLRALTAAVILALVLPAAAAAAEATRVASSGDEDNPFDLDFTIKAQYLQTRALITREYTYDYANAQPLDTVEERPELRYTRRTFAFLPRIAVGLYKDLEFHVEVPIILSSNTRWHYAFHDGEMQTDGTSATGQNDIDASGAPCGGPCPVFPGSGTVYHGTGFGDIKLGIAWGILSDTRDDTKPFWLVGVDFTLPTAKMYEPGLGRTAPAYTSPSYNKAGDASPFGENILKIDLVTALSKRMGAADPYVKFHVTSFRPSAETYSNCDHPELLGTNGATLCEASSRSKYGSRPPWIAGAAFGAEIVTGENKAEGTRVAIDVRLAADYVSSSRWYNELTDMTGKLLRTEDYFDVQAFFGFYWRASKYMQFQATANLGTETPHFITGESVGDPNYDARYDAAGRRYRLTEVSNFGLALAGVLQF